MYDVRGTRYDLGRMRSEAAGTAKQMRRDVLEPRAGVVRKRRRRLAAPGGRQSLPMYEVRGTIEEFARVAKICSGWQMCSKMREGRLHLHRGVCCHCGFRIRKQV